LNFFTTSQKLHIYDSYIKFFGIYAIDARQVLIKKTTVMFAKNSIPIFKEVTHFQITDSFIKNQEFVWKPTSERLEKVVLKSNDYFGCI